MNTTLKEQIIEVLDGVPDANLPEVVHFLEFLTWKARREHAARPAPEANVDLLAALRGRGQGERLVELLLQSRRADLALDEQSRQHVRL